MPDSRIVAVLGADDRFSRPLAATVRSILAHLTPGRELDLYLCDMGITPRNRELIETVTRHPDVRTRWIDSLSAEVGHLPETWPGITRAAYARLFIPAFLPAETKALYLDCDLIVRRCVGELYDTEMGDYAAMGVADAASPFVCSPYGVPFWARYGREAGETNFNSGVLLMNLPVWREDDIAGAAFKYLTSERHQGMVDQEAINAVLPGRIGTVDPRWNQQTEHFVPRFQATLPYPEELFQELLENPWIVHYTTNSKAWSYTSRHPFRDEWFAHLDQTPYAGWRPSRRAYYSAQSGKVLKAVRGRISARGK